VLLIAFATQRKLSQEAILAKARELGINLEQPAFEQFLETLSVKHLYQFYAQLTRTEDLLY